MTLPRSLLIGLIVSATLNVFLVGGIVGALWVRKGPPPPSPAPAPAAAQSALSPEELLPEPSPALPAARPQPAPRSAPATGAAPQDDQLTRPPLWSAGKGLSPESRRALRQTLREANQQNRPITRQARAERQAALLAFRAKPYEADEVTKRLAAARALDVQARGNVEAALANYANTLSPVERAALADGLGRVYAPRQRPAQADPK